VLVMIISKRLYLDGHCSDAACDAFIEINDRVKKLFSIVHPQEKTPDGDTAMKRSFLQNLLSLRYVTNPTILDSTFKKDTWNAIRSNVSFAQS